MFVIANMCLCVLQSCMGNGDDIIVSKKSDLIITIAEIARIDDSGTVYHR
jgi:hypothetical protein